jgi:hypothetical protein
MRRMTSCRLSYMIVVYSGISPPPIERRLAVNAPPMFVERTVRPMTSPSTAWMR